jgi:hypothetical protein
MNAGMWTMTDELMQLLAVAGFTTTPVPRLVQESSPSVPFPRDREQSSRRALGGLS